MQMTDLIKILKDDNLPVKLDNLNWYLNQEPPREWIKKDPISGALYLPIERVEFLLRKLFKGFKIEVREVASIFNGARCTVRVHYLNPATNEWDYHDGVGAKNLQVNKGANPTDMTQIKANAVTLAVPIAKSEAVKNACKSFGRLFGSDLNRTSSPDYRVELIEMTPNHPNWDKMVEAVKSGAYSVEKVQEVYNLSEENLNILKKNIK